MKVALIFASALVDTFAGVIFYLFTIGVPVAALVVGWVFAGWPGLLVVAFVLFASAAMVLG